MAKFTKSFKGCTGGEIYPSEFAEGDDCPADLIDAALEMGAIAAVKATAEEQAEAKAQAEAEAKAKAKADTQAAAKAA